MRLTLDWDDPADLQTNFEAVRQRVLPENIADDEQQTLTGFSNEQGGPYELWQSAGGEGYHYIEHGAVETIGEQWGFRDDYGDDPKRLSSDQFRWDYGSPYVQTLWVLKHLSPHHTPPFHAAEHRAELIESEGITTADEALEIEIEKEQIRDERQIREPGGSIDYSKLVRLLREHPHYGSGAALGKELKQAGFINAKSPKDSVNQWVTRRDPANSNIPGLLAALRYRAKKLGIAHYKGPKDARGTHAARDDPRDVFTAEEKERFAPKGEYPAGDQRRSFGEIFYVVDFHADENEDSVDPITLRTGYYGPEYDDDGQKVGPDQLRLWDVHNRFANEVADILSPHNPNGNDYQASRMDAGINYENRHVPHDEQRLYWANLRRRWTQGVNSIQSRPEDNIVLQVLAFDDEAFSEVKWFFLGVMPEHGRFMSDVEVICDTNGWWP